MKAALIISVLTLFLVFIMVVYLYNDQFDYITDIFTSIIPKSIHKKSTQQKHRQMYYSINTERYSPKIINNNEREQPIIYLNRNRNKTEFSSISTDYGMKCQHEKIDTYPPINPKPYKTEDNPSSREPSPQRVIDSMPPPPIRKIPSTQWEESSSYQSRSPSPQSETNFGFSGPARIYDMPI